jgi:cytidylate kinase
MEARANGIIIAIDGPTASGKSTTASLVANELGYLHINTGAMYRAFALYCSQWDITEPSDARVKELAERAYIDFDENGNILLEGKSVADEIFSSKISELSSKFSSLPEVREKMVALQREIGKDGGVVLDGRDIGTVVFPDAELKIYLVASPEERAKRRFLELNKENGSRTAGDLAREIAERDKRDTERDISPLRKAEDAVELDTSKLTIEKQVEKVLEFARKKITAT